jgi:hypothetical protein
MYSQSRGTPVFKEVIAFTPVFVTNTATCKKLLFSLLSSFCRVVTITYLNQTQFLGYIALRLFCIYNVCYTIMLYVLYLYTSVGRVAQSV